MSSSSIAIAMALSLVVGGAVGAGAMRLAFSFAATAPQQTCPAAVAVPPRPVLPFTPVPTTGSKGF